MELNYQAIINAIQYQTNVLIQTKYTDLVCYVVNEQAFDKKKLKSNEMVVVVRFGAASVFQKKIDLPIYFDIIALPNEIKRTQEFFTDFALMYNESVNDGILQFYNTPSIANRFNDYGYETRTTLNMQGALVISLNNGIVDIQVLNETTNEYESVRFLNEELSSNFTPLPEPTGDSNGRNITTNQANTITLSFATYFTESEFINNIVKYAFDSSLSFNKRFSVRVNIADIYTLEETFVVSQATISRRIAENSTLSITMVV